MKFVEAVDGFTISHADMIRNEFATRSEWRDPHSGRRITKGEGRVFYISLQVVATMYSTKRNYPNS